MALNSDTSAGSQSGQVVYYPGPRIVVTSRYIENAHGRYPIREIQLIEQVHVLAHPARTMALICGAVEVAVAAPLAAAIGSAALLCTGLLAAFGVAAALVIDGRHNPRWMGLRATHRGQEFTLFSTRDQEEFQRVRLAVVRAIQADRSPRP